MFVIIVEKMLKSQDYLLMIPARIEDDTGEISITFFGKLAEKLLGMTTDEAAEIVEESADEGCFRMKS